MSETQTQSVNSSHSKWVINTVYTISYRSYKSQNLFGENFMNGKNELRKSSVPQHKVLEQPG